MTLRVTFPLPKWFVFHSRGILGSRRRSRKLKFEGAIYWLIHDYFFSVTSLKKESHWENDYVKFSRVKVLYDSTLFRMNVHGKRFL